MIEWEVKGAAQEQGEGEGDEGNNEREFKRDA